MMTDYGDLDFHDFMDVPPHLIGTEEGRKHKEAFLKEYNSPDYVPDAVDLAIEAVLRRHGMHHK
jgi:hypothetical protein